jgi:hypothetical protein
MHDDMNVKSLFQILLFSFVLVFLAIKVLLAAHYFSSLASTTYKNNFSVSCRGPNREHSKM